MRSDGNTQLTGKALTEGIGGKTMRRLPMEQSVV